MLASRSEICDERIAPAMKDSAAQLADDGNLETAGSTAREKLRPSASGQYYLELTHHGFLVNRMDKENNFNVYEQDVFLVNPLSRVSNWIQQIHSSSRSGR